MIISPFKNKVNNFKKDEKYYEVKYDFASITAAKDAQIYHRKTYLLGSLTAAVRRRKETAIERKNSNKKGENPWFSTLDFLQIKAILSEIGVK